ncbi:hypothetical protein CONLIGDRAFT_699803 [Coniochaeta ligniaria NRRL 30616]|uniref:Uncharacterized protein n=1 Tax=Coniochaeta ligniaria NRRL 30616 TaxID=1408157 RepID=A0A1J7I440_9PEZI|nr:hypothetical protein CONLIGDRAFT_699803 [Coniochaeta ligniaria NRRL 30616]
MGTAPSTMAQPDPQSSPLNPNPSPLAASPQDSAPPPQSPQRDPSQSPEYRPSQSPEHSSPQSPRSRASSLSNPFASGSEDENENNPGAQNQNLPLAGIGPRPPPPAQDNPVQGDQADMRTGRGQLTRMPERDAEVVQEMGLLSAEVNNNSPAIKARWEKLVAVFWAKAKAIQAQGVHGPEERCVSICPHHLSWHKMAIILVNGRDMQLTISPAQKHQRHPRLRRRRRPPHTLVRAGRLPRRGVPGHARPADQDENAGRRLREGAQGGEPQPQRAARERPEPRREQVEDVSVVWARDLHYR